ncbi:unnamed protein product [Cyclocybe aegerita]|uniref:Uncharacterized protein n=1 Tax=Cyclocybe aegerita TaxID=1973307 RepID=A0A8S0XNK8_CYCAE|nr:unnamed protein product [Cyclocybe aegerita]
MPLPSCPQFRPWDTFNWRHITRPAAVLAIHHLAVACTRHGGSIDDEDADTNPPCHTDKNSHNIRATPMHKTCPGMTPRLASTCCITNPPHLECLTLADVHHDTPPKPGPLPVKNPYPWVQALSPQLIILRVAMGHAVTPESLRGPLPETLSLAQVATTQIQPTLMVMKA